MATLEELRKREADRLAKEQERKRQAEAESTNPRREILPGEEVDYTTGTIRRLPTVQRNSYFDPPSQTVAQQASRRVRTNQPSQDQENDDVLIKNLPQNVQDSLNVVSPEQREKYLLRYRNILSRNPSLQNLQQTAASANTIKNNIQGPSSSQPVTSGKLPGSPLNASQFGGRTPFDLTTIEGQQDQRAAEDLAILRSIDRNQANRIRRDYNSLRTDYLRAANRTFNPYQRAQARRELNQLNDLGVRGYAIQTRRNSMQDIGGIPRIRR